MRIPLALMCCVFFIFKYEPAEGQLIKGFLDKVHVAADKVRHDIRRVLRPNEGGNNDDRNTNNSAIFFQDNSGSRPSPVNPVSSTTIQPVTASTPITKQPEPVNNSELFVFKSDNTEPSQPGLSAITSSTTTSPVTSSTTTRPVNTADVIVFVTEEATTTTTMQSIDPDGKDGKENFSGGCLAGYMRTPDGRCMPTF